MKTSLYSIEMLNENTKLFHVPNSQMYEYSGGGGEKIHLIKLC